jgi:hypothetical protein
MPLFSMNKINPMVFELRIDNVLKKIVSLREAQRTQNEVNAYLSDNMYPQAMVDVLENFSVQFEDPDKIKEFEYLFLVGNDKYMVPLPKELSFSGDFLLRQGSDVCSDTVEAITPEPDNACAYSPNTESKPLIYTYRNLTKYTKFWEQDDYESLQQELFAQLSADIIEIPYADVPYEYEYRFGQVAFHPNHGSAHAVRLVTLFNKYLNLAQITPTAELPAVGKEEETCLTLAMFLFRSGRTNEIGWSDDTSYSKRSAAIFSHIAEVLGYSKVLVDVIAQCFDYEAVIHTKGFLDKTQSEGNKSIFVYQKLFQLAHNSDLVRCSERYEKVKKSLTDALIRLLNCSFDPEVVDEYLQFAAQCCVATGAPVTIRELQGSGGSYGGNGYKMVQTANNIVQSLKTLSTLAPSSPKHHDLSFFSSSIASSAASEKENSVKIADSPKRF